MLAFETTARIDDAGQLHLDEPLMARNRRAKVVVLLEEPSDTTEWLGAMAANPSFAFLHDADENLYTAEDGTPVS